MPGSTARSWPPAERVSWAALIEASASAGERLVALRPQVDRGSWQIRALIGFADPIRPGIADAMATARGAGIQVIVVTGDHPQTAATIARQAALPADRVVTGEEIATWSDERLAAEPGRPARRRPFDPGAEAPPRPGRPRPTTGSWP